MPKNYDEAIKKLNLLLEQMESDEAMSIEQYKKKATEAKDLIAFCERQLKVMSDELYSSEKSTSSER